MFFSKIIDHFDCLLSLQEVEHCTAEKCIYKDGKVFTCYCDTKRTFVCAYDGEIILQQKSKNTNNSIVLQLMFMILTRLPFLMHCFDLLYTS